MVGELGLAVVAELGVGLEGYGPEPRRDGVEPSIVRHAHIIELLADIGRMLITPHDRRESVVQRLESIQFDKARLDFTAPILGWDVGAGISLEKSQDLVVSPRGVIVAAGPRQQRAERRMAEPTCFPSRRDARR